MPIRQWPDGDQPRVKLRAQGAQSLTDAELIAILFNTGYRGSTALELAKTLLVAHGSLKNLIQAPPLPLKGVGEAKCATLKAAIELGKRYLSSQLNKGEALTSSHMTRAFLADRLKHHLNEVFACLFMDTHLRLIQYDELFQGTINEASVYPREIVRRGLTYNAAKIILAHNHPSGMSTPSIADQEVTKRIKQALALVDIEVVDHIIIGLEETFSFAENHLI
jgi:DNA repair protein RadC